MYWLQHEILRKFSIPILILLGVWLGGSMGYWILGHLYGHHWSMFSCAYMTLITLSTVGYGDILGVEGNRSWVLLGWTGLIIMCGLGIVAYGMSQLTALIVQGELQRYLKRSKMEKEILALRGHYIVCGAGSTARPVIQELVSTGRKVIVIDTNLERLEEIAQRLNVAFVHGDCLEDETFPKANIEHATGVFAILPHDRDNLFVTVTARGLNSQLRVVSKAIDPKMMAKLVRSGANAVVSPNQIGGMRLASEMIRPTVVKFLDRMLKTDQHVRIEEVQIQAGCELDNVKLGEARIFEKTGLVVVSIYYKDSEQILYNPPPDTLLYPNAVLVVMANEAQRAKLLAMATADENPVPS